MVACVYLDHVRLRGSSNIQFSRSTTGKGLSINFDSRQRFMFNFSYDDDVDELHQSEPLWSHHAKHDGTVMHFH